MLSRMHSGWLCSSKRSGPRRRRDSALCRRSVHETRPFTFHRCCRFAGQAAGDAGTRCTDPDPSKGYVERVGAAGCSASRGRTIIGVRIQTSDGICRLCCLCTHRFQLLTGRSSRTRTRSEDHWRTSSQRCHAGRLPWSRFAPPRSRRGGTSNRASGECSRCLPCAWRRPSAMRAARLIARGERRFHLIRMDREV